MKAASIVLFGILALGGCGPELNRLSQVHGVRILAIKKTSQQDKQPAGITAHPNGASWAQPGEVVDFSMLWFNGSPKQPKKPVERAWIAGCLNPDTGDYRGCADKFKELDPAALASSIKTVEPPADENPVSTYSTYEDIVQFTMPTGPAVFDNPKLKKGDVPAGVYVVFAAACAGKLTVAPGAGPYGLPVVCVDRDTGARLGADEFVVAYTNVYIFDPSTGFKNDNPVIPPFQSFYVSTGDPVADYLPMDPSEGLACIGEQCFKKQPTPDDPTPAETMNVPGDLCTRRQSACLPPCPEDGDVDNCPGPVLYPTIIGDQNAETYTDPSAPGNGPVYERMWVNYHVDRGNTRSDIRLLRDGNAGWNGDYATNYYAPKEKGPVHVWAVVRDNRGGVEWIHIPLVIQ